MYFSKLQASILGTVILFSFICCNENTPSPTIEQPSSGWDYAQKAWGKVPQLLAQIQKPTFPDQSFSIIDYGAIADGETKNTEAFKKAIVACHEAGGGRVIVPKGTFFTGSIHLKNNVNLHLAEGAVISFSTDYQDYLPVVRTHWEGMECMNFSALIFASECENVAITGKGILEGNGDFDNWWAWSVKELHKTPESRPRLMELNRTGAPLEDRVFGGGYYLRPNFIQFYKCKNILAEGFTMQNSTMWNLHTVLSENITIDGITVIAPYESPNTDALDFESSKNILVQNSIFDVGDDCITIKSGRNQDGRRINTSSENLIARNCYVKNGRGGIVIGSEITGGARNIYMEDCKMDSPNLNRAVRIKSSEVRGGHIRDLFVRNIEIGAVGGPVLNIDLHYGVREAERDGNLYIPKCENVYLENITCQQADHAWYLDGYKDEPILNVFMRNITIDEVSQPITQNYVRNLSLENVNVSIGKGRKREAAK